MKKLVLNVVDSLEKKKESVKIPKCWVCMDQGLVFYDKKENGIIYEIASRCRCVKGQSIGESVGYIPSVLMEDIANINFENFKKAYPEIADRIVQAL